MDTDIYIDTVIDIRMKITKFLTRSTAPRKVTPPPGALRGS